MNWKTRWVNAFLRFVFKLVCRINLDELKKIPPAGPLIIVGNHINFLEAPVLVPHVNNPNMIGIAKRESWKNPLFRILFDLWGIIPIDRETIDREAFRQMVEVLDAGKILVIFPEGTRSKDGKMLPGKPGVVMLAMKSGAPILPVAFYGYESFWSNLKKLRKTDFHINVGTPFKINLNGNGPTREIRQIVTDEIMFKIAELLPENYRGYYAFEESVNYRYSVNK